MGNQHGTRRKATNDNSSINEERSDSYAATDKLYYSPAALSGAAVFITAFVGGIDMPCERIDVVAKTSVTGTALRDLNVLETVPFVILADGTVLSETQVILDYLIERAPKQLGSSARNTQYFYMKQIISYISTNLTPSLDLLSRSGSMGEANIEFFRSIAERALTILEEYFLDRKQFLIGHGLSVADIVLYTALSAAKTIGIALDKYPRLTGYFDRLDKDTSVEAAQTRMLGNPATILLDGHKNNGSSNNEML